MHDPWKRKRLVLSSITLATGAAILGVASHAGAFEILDNWWGEEKSWDDPPTQLQYDRCSLPLGSARYLAARDNVEAWNRTGGIVNPLFLVAGDDDCRLGLGDGDNEIIYVDPGEIDNAWGRTYTHLNLWHSGELLEADILIANDVSPVPATDPALSNAGNVGRASMLHEIGHFIGLGHDFDFLNIMRQGVKPLVPAHPGLVMVMPDDQQGARQHYAGVGNETNVFLSGQVFLPSLPQDIQDRFIALAGNPNGASANVLSYQPAINLFNPNAASCNIIGGGCTPFVQNLDGANDAVIDVCPGDSFSVPVSVGTRSNAPGDPVNHQVGFFVGDDSWFDPDLQQMLVGNEIDVNTTNVQALVQTVTLTDDPDCIVPGPYRMWVGADICQQLLEANQNIAHSPNGLLERDNVLRTSVKLNLLDPADPACAAGPAADNVCDEPGYLDFCQDPPAEPPPNDDLPQGYYDCPDPGGCLGAECAPTDPVDPGTALDPNSAYHPDGDGSPTGFCDDAIIGEEATCVRELFDNQAYPICRSCAGESLGPGCECHDDTECLPDLSCYGEDEDGVGTCWDPSGPPSWQCGVDCAEIYGQNTGFCYHEGINGAVCMDALCSGLELAMCDEKGLFCDASKSCQDDDDNGVLDCCVSECEDEQDCIDLGYTPGAFYCDLFQAAGRCRPV